MAVISHCMMRQRNWGLAMNSKVLADHLPGRAAVEDCRKRNETHDRQRSGQAKCDHQHPPPSAFFFYLVCLIQPGHHGPSAIQGTPNGAQSRVNSARADNGSGIQLTNGFRH